MKCKYNVIISAVLFTLFISIHTTSGAVPYINNSGFETGNFDGWEASDFISYYPGVLNVLEVQSSVKHSGNYAVHGHLITNDTSEGNYAFHEIYQPYLYGNASKIRFYLNIPTLNGSPNAYFKIIGKTSTNNLTINSTTSGWQLYELDISSENGDGTVYFFIESVGPSEIEYYLDDVTDDYAIVTDFTSNITYGYSPYTAVQFTGSVSSGYPITWNWSFGDGTYSNQQNPVHIYTTPGNYTVKLNVSNGYYYDIEEKTNYIRIYPLEVNFTSNTTFGYAPSWAIVQFYSNVTNGTATSYNWSFGDGYYSNEINPVHAYTTPGNYTVKLNVSNEYTYTIEEKTNYITVDPAPVPVADFEANVTTGIKKITVGFTDLSTNSPTLWSWYYNAGSGWVLFSTQQNPTHSFETGVYSIKLIARNMYGSGSTEKTGYITVKEKEDWLPGYYYKAKINITGNETWSEPVYNYPVALYIYTGTGTCTNNIIYLNNLGNLNELRFTDINNNLLTYTQVETNIFYVKIPYIDNSSTNATQIYMYYGHRLPQSSLSTWDNGGAFLFGDDFSENPINRTRWNISVNNISYTGTSPIRITNATYIQGYEEFYDVYNTNSIASQLQANWSIPDNVEIIFKSRIIIPGNIRYGKGSAGFGFVGSDNKIKAFLGHGMKETFLTDARYYPNGQPKPLCIQSNSGCQCGLCSYGCPCFKQSGSSCSDYDKVIAEGWYDGYYIYAGGLSKSGFWVLYKFPVTIAEFKYLLGGNRQFYSEYPSQFYAQEYIAGIGKYCTFTMYQTNEYFVSGDTKDTTRYFAIKKENNKVTLLKYNSIDRQNANEISNSTISGISKFALIAGTNGVPAFTPHAIYIYYVLARENINPLPTATVVECSSFLDPAYIYFNKKIYSSEDNLTVKTEIPDWFWNTLEYSYSAYIFNSNNLRTPVKSWSITSRNQLQSYDVAELGQQGVYYAYLYMTRKGTTTSYLLDTDYMVTYDGFVLNGYTYSAPTGEILPNTTVELKYLDTTLTNSSRFDGYYLFRPITSGVNVTVTATKSGFLPYNDTILNVAKLSIMKNISLIPENQSEYWTLETNGNALYGFVLIYPYNITANGAVFRLSNNTWSSNITIGPTGWYMFNNLSNNSTYNVNIELEPYIPISSNVTTGENTLTRKDFVFISGTYPLTVYILDSTTGGIFTAEATITLNDGKGKILTNTTSNGTYTYNNMYGQYILTVSSSGYKKVTRTIVVDSEKTVVVTLYPDTQATTSTYYNPHEVKITIQDMFGRGLPNTTVTVTPTTSTLEVIENWLTRILGITDQSIEINSTPLSGVTDGYGAVSFVMIKEVLYAVKIENSELGVDETKTLYPKEDAYVFVVSTNRDVKPQTPAAFTVTWSITNETINSTHEYINFSYYDPEGKTTNVTFWVKSHGSPITTCYEQVCNTPNSCTGSYCCNAFNGEEYYCGMTITRAGETFTHTQIIAYPKLVDLGISPVYYPWIAVAFLVVIAAAFSVISVRFGAVLIPIFAFLFYQMGWLTLGQNGLILLTVLLTIGVLSYIRKQEDRMGG